MNITHPGEVECWCTSVEVRHVPHDSIRTTVNVAAWQHSRTTPDGWKIRQCVLCCGCRASVASNCFVPCSTTVPAFEGSGALAILVEPAQCWKGPEPEAWEPVQRA